MRGGRSCDPGRALVALALVAALSLGGGGCAGRLVRLENRVLRLENERLEDELEASRARSLPADYALSVDMAVLEDFARRAGFPELEKSQPNVLIAQMKGENTEFRIMFQLFEQERVLYIAAIDYFRLEQARDSRAMVSLLSQMAAINYQMLLGKLQLNPQTGAITLSAELNLDDGLGFTTFRLVAQHVARTADQRYPELLRAAGGEGI